MMEMAQITGETSSEAVNNVHGPMMIGLTGMGSSWMWLGGIFWLVTWILVIAVLIAVLRLLWQKGNK